MSLLIDSLNAIATALDTSEYKVEYCCERCAMTHDEMVAEREVFQADWDAEQARLAVDARAEYDALVKEALEEEEALHWQYFMDGV